MTKLRITIGLILGLTMTTLLSAQPLGGGGGIGGGIGGGTPYAIGIINDGDVEIDAIDDSADTTVYIKNSDATYKANLNIEGNVATTGTVSAEQLTSTDDASITDLITAARAQLTATTTSMATLDIKAFSSTGAVTFNGGGNDDMTTNDAFAGRSTTNYKVEIDDGDPTDPNTFRWSNDGGATWEAEGVEISEEDSLDNNVAVTFASQTGHDTADFWTFTAAAYTNKLTQWQDAIGGINASMNDQGELTLVTYEEQGGDQTIKQINGTINFSGNVGDDNYSKIYHDYLNMDLSGTKDIEVGSYVGYGHSYDIDSSVVVTGATHNLFGGIADINFSGSVGAAGTLNIYGYYSYPHGNMGTTGTTHKYGFYTLVTNTADINDGLYIDVSGATLNRGIVIDSDNAFIYMGELQTDYYFGWDGNDAVHTITAGDFVFTGGNVGIGTATPSNILSLYGSNIGINLIESGDSKVWTLRNSSSLNCFAVQEDATGTFRLVVEEGGNVGVGLDDPTEKLDVLGQSILVGGDIGTYTARTNSTNKLGELAVPHYLNAEESVEIFNAANYVNSNELNFGGGVSNRNTATHIRFYGAANNTTLTGTALMTIYGYGDIYMNADLGVGTATPDTKVHIEDANAVTASKGNLYVQSNSAFAIDKGGQISLGGKFNTAGSIVVSYGAVAGRKENAVDGNAGGYLQFATSDIAGGALSEKMRIESNGDVGIGTTNPAANLTIEENHNADTYIHIANSTAGNAAYVGIYMTTNSSAGGFYCFDDGYADAGYADKFVMKSQPTATALMFEAQAAAGDIQFYTDGHAAANLRMTINSTGIGINTAPATLFHVKDGYMRFQRGASDYCDFGIIGAGHFLIQTMNNKNTQIWDNAGMNVDFQDGGNVHIANDNAKLQIGATATDLEIFSDGTNGIIDVDAELRIGTDGGTTNYSAFESDGTLKFNGTATVFDDLRTPVNMVKVPATKAPTWTAYNGTQLLGFSYQAVEANEEEIYFTIQLPHSYKEGSNIVPHIHWVPNEDTTDDPEVVRWGLEYEWQNIDGTFAGTTTIHAEESMTDKSDDHLKTLFSAIDGTGKTISSVVTCRLFRNSSSVNDTYDNGTALALFLEIDFHFEIDTIGSRLVNDSK